MNRFFMVIMACFLMISSSPVLAQDPEGWDDASSQDTPVDGGLSLLVAAGLGYGIRQRQKRKATPANP